ncbi:MAG: hypothetical protein Q8K70_07370 [Bacteroidota bacterium]|nr:hypothetical protein [Bacteroidota bacterium]
MFKNLILIFLLFIFFVSCNDTKNKCEDAICTQIFAMATVEINSNDTLQTQSFLLPEKTLLHFQDGTNLSFNNSYIIADDSHLKILGYNNTRSIEFIVLKKGTVVHVDTFIIATDCCHISKTKGSEVIDLN